MVFYSGGKLAADLTLPKLAAPLGTDRRGCRSSGRRPARAWRAAGAGWAVPG